jgi:hypothetical protein
MIRLYAEFADPAALLEAARTLRATGHHRIELHSSYPLPEHLLTAAGFPARPPAWASLVTFVAGVGAATGAYALQWLLNAYLYPLNVGGRPAHFPLAFVPITFEMGVLFAALATFGMIAWGGGLFRWWNPSSEISGIESATGTGFWVEVGPQNDTDREAITQMLVASGALVVNVEEL